MERNMQETTLNLEFQQFDVNEASEGWDYESEADWATFNQFLVSDGCEHGEIMQGYFGFDPDAIDSGDYETFAAGVQYAVARMNAALQAAGSKLEIKQVDLADGDGFLLCEGDQTESQWARAVFSKKAKKLG
jgi:hypothetical protein